MKYVIVLKTIVDDNGVHNVIEKIEHDEDSVSLKTMYKLCECDCIDIKTIFPLYNVAVVYDDEFLLNKSGDDLYANQLASILYGYNQHGECLCGSVMLCETTEDGDCVPFEESKADNLIALLESIDKQIGDVKFVVQEPKMSFKMW